MDDDVPQTTVFDLDVRWRLHPRVSLRPESFGALLYHFGTRRLSFVKDRTLTDVVTGLDHHSSARSACIAAGLGADVPVDVTAALATLAANRMITPTEES
jgi:putative mycofactocin binding protein MftB